jgi:hypothetical protein
LFKWVALVVQQTLFIWAALVAQHNLVQMGCIGRSPKSCSNGLHWSFNKILFKWVALVVQQNLVEIVVLVVIVRNLFYIVVSGAFQVLRSLVFIHDNTFRI